MYIKMFENFENDIENDINEALDGYLQAIIFTEELQIDDFDEKSVNESRNDIVDFFDKLDEYDLLDELSSHLSYESIGADFWYTRNGHGVGFYDRDLGDLGVEVSNIAEKYKSKDVFIQNEKIYIE